MEIENFTGEIKENEPLSRHTSFNIGGPADVLAYPANREELIKLLKEISRRRLNYFILGGGTNVLVRDGGFRGVVIALERMRAVRIEREYRSLGGAFAVVYAEAGAPLPALHFLAAEQGLTGLEFAAGIPGTVGGAVCMNAGTAAGEFGDIVESVTLISPAGEYIRKTREEMGFGYRVANIPEGHLVIDARVVLRRGDKEQIKACVRGLLDKRKQRQPMGYPSAGSVFKNPLDRSAGKLIETAKLKGKTVGGAQVSDKHANFIVNLGKATARDVLALMEIIKQTVLDAHGVRLEPEIKIIGEDL
jgi:UDP-N-acetylmuramate dehydrogenase